METLKEKILTMIEKKRINEGKSGDEDTTITMQLTEAQKQEFLEIDWSDEYFWEIEDDNTLYISYSELE